MRPDSGRAGARCKIRNAPEKPWPPLSRALTLTVTKEPGGGGVDEAGDVTEYFTLTCDEPPYAVVLLDCGPRETDVVRALCEVTGLSLWHSRVLTRRTPVAVLEGRPQDMADEAVAVLRGAGAQAETRQEPEPKRSAAPAPWRPAGGSTA
ncbi:ribosomal protein L7/L12 [Streptomyces sp. NPDC017254]